MINLANLKCTNCGRKGYGLVKPRGGSCTFVVCRKCFRHLCTLQGSDEKNAWKIWRESEKERKKRAEFDAMIKLAGC